MSEKFDQFLDDLARDPAATSPAELDEKTIRVMRALAMAEQTLPDPGSHVRTRVWQRTLAGVQPRRVKANWLSFAAAIVVIGLVIMSASWLTKPHIIGATAQSTATAQPTAATPQPVFTGYAGVAVYKILTSLTSNDGNPFSSNGEKYIWYRSDDTTREETYLVGDKSVWPIGNEEQATFHAMSFSDSTGQLPINYHPASIFIRHNNELAYYSATSEEINSFTDFFVRNRANPTFYNMRHQYGPIGASLEQGELALKTDWGNVQVVRNKTILGRDAYVLSLKDRMRDSYEYQPEIDHIIAWVDQQTLIFLGDQEFDANGHLLSEWSFTSLEVDPQLDTKLFTLQAPRNVLQYADPNVQQMTLDHMDEQWPQIAKTASFAIFKPTGIPNQQIIDGAIFSTAGRPLQYDADRHLLTAEYLMGNNTYFHILEGSPDMIDWTDPTYETVQIGSITGHYRDSYRRVLVFERDGTQIALITAGSGYGNAPASTSALSKDELIKLAASFIAVSQRL